MQDMRDLYKAYAAVHDTTIKEELDNSKDQITEMNLSQMTEGDLVEVAEEIIEGLFQYGLDLDEAYGVVGDILEAASDNIIGDRKSKIVRIAESFEEAFDTVTDKAERNCEEAFLLYRKQKPLTEKWNNKVSHETGNAKIHAAIIHEDREGVKLGLIEMLSDVMEASDIQYPTGDKKKFTKDKSDPKVAAGRKAAKEMGLKHNEETEVSTLRQGWGDAYSSIYEKKMDPVGQEDGDIDNDGDEDSSDKYLAKRRKAIGKAMGKKKVDEKFVFPGQKKQDQMSKKMDDINNNVKPIKDQEKRVDAAFKRNERIGKIDRTLDSMKYDTKDFVKDARDKKASNVAKGMKKEGVEFSQGELDRIQEIVNSWED